MEIKYLAIITGGYTYVLGSNDKKLMTEYIPLRNYTELSDGGIELLGLIDTIKISKEKKENCKILVLKNGSFVD